MSILNLFMHLSCSLWIAKILHMIVGEYEQRAVYTCYNVVGNGHETFGVIYSVN